MTTIICCYTAKYNTSIDNFENIAQPYAGASRWTDRTFSANYEQIKSRISVENCADVLFNGRVEGGITSVLTFVCDRYPNWFPRVYGTKTTTADFSENVLNKSNDLA